MAILNKNKSLDYQTILLFFSWTVSVFSIAITMLFHVEVELTPVILLLVLFDMLVNLKIGQLKNFNKIFFNTFFLIIIFYGWIIFSNAYSPSLEYKYEKSFKFIVNLFFFIYPFFIRKINFQLIIKLYALFILPISAYFVFLLSIVWTIKSKQTENFMNVKNSYLVIGIHLGILFLILQYFSKNIILKVITFFLLIASSARGPLIFTVITSIIFYFSQSSKKISTKQVSKSIAAIVGVGIIYVYKSDMINSLLSKTILRFTSLNSGNDLSSLERIKRLETAFYTPFEKISTFLIGNGIGSFGILFDKVDKRSYPHNIFLECFFELGVIGLLILIILMINIFSKLNMKNNIFSLLFIFVFFNSMKSSNITDLWLLFSFMGGVILVHTNNLNKYYNLKQISK